MLLTAGRLTGDTTLSTDDAIPVPDNGSAPRLDDADKNATAE